MKKRGTPARTRNNTNNYLNQLASCKRSAPVLTSGIGLNFCPKSKRSVSPVIATILLIALTIIIGLIVFQWMKGFTKEAVTKFEGQNIELVCDDVQIDASYSLSTETLTISNLGNVPIYNFNVKAEFPGGHETNDLENFDGLAQGGIFSEVVPVPDGTTTITLIPILLGVNKDGEQKTQACEERQGKEIFV